MDRPRPRIELEDAPTPRLESEPFAALTERRREVGTLVLVLGGAGFLGCGFIALATVNFVVDQFARAFWLGWLTAAVAIAGFSLIAVGLGREWRGLLALNAVDRARAELASGDASRVHKAAREWARNVPEAVSVVPAIDAINDPDTIVALLRDGAAATLRARADTLGQVAAGQMLAGVAAMPSPEFAVLLTGWRGLRLVRQIAALYGMRPGLLATLGLVRRTAVAATLVGVTEVAVNAAAHAVLSNPLLRHAAGEVAGAGVAARRMIVLARAAAAACDPFVP